MMVRINLLVALLLVSLTSLKGQTHSSLINRNLTQVNQQMNIVRTGGENYALEDIEGSPYLTKEFENSQVLMKNGDTLNNARMRFNLFMGNFEFKKQGTVYQLVNGTDIRQIEHQGLDFVYTPYHAASGKRYESFLVRLVEGTCSIYKRPRVKFKGPEPAQTSFHNPKPPRFEEEDPSYFILFKDQEEMPRQIESLRRGRFLDHFGSLENELKNYIKDQDIDLKEEAGLVRFIRYYNEHYGNNQGQGQ
jgi:hypothetical protein